LIGFDRYFHAPFAACRAFLFSRLFLVVVALDTWMLMIGHAGRYGVDGFNVAHFAWLDRIAPLPTAGLYVGVLLLAGLLALAIALGGTHRVALAALFGLYTFSWAMSMLDSYQHHYFVSSVLLCLVFFPAVRADDVHPPPAPPPTAPTAPTGPTAKPKPVRARRGRPSVDQRAATARQPSTRYLVISALALAAFIAWPSPQHRVLAFIVCSAVLAAATLLYARRRTLATVLVHGFGYNLLGATVAVLYTYTSIAKLDTQWLDGQTLTRISSATRVFAPLAELAASLGVPADRFWSALATSVIPVELLLGACYAVAVVADASASRWPRRVALLGFALAMTLHLGAEAMELEIGWFSYYMILFACAYLLPGRVVDTLATLITAPTQFAAHQLRDLLRPDSGDHARATTLALAAGAAVSVAAVGKMLDLPGALVACGVAAAALLGLAALANLRGAPLAVRPALLGTGIAAALMWSAIAFSQTRWDFYRFLGGDLRRRGEPTSALEAYERGERYAPKGESRRDQIDALRRELGR
jgi:hypothetical protein